MKIERISDTQIKCILDNKDLLDREIKINELAYGTDKARALFKDMMQQAFQDYGFATDDTPIMIEAVPLSSDRIMLIVTKVDDGDDFEETFANLPSQQLTKEDPEKPPTIRKANFPELKREDSTDELLQAFYVYHFDNIDTIIEAARQIDSRYFEESLLFRNRQDSSYLLIISGDSVPRSFHYLVRGILSEYGEASSYRKNTLSFFEEHYQPIIKQEALAVLARL